jgi:hypothetical protein
VRLASHHDAVTVHAFAPPAPARGAWLQGTLARKAADARTVGSDALWDPAWQQAGPPSLPDAHEQLRALAAHHAAAAPSRGRPPRVVLAAPHAVVVAVFDSPVQPVRVHPADPTCAPVVHAARALQAARPWPGHLAVPTAAVRRALHWVRECQRQQRACVLAGAAPWPAPTVRAMLHRLAHETRAAPRRDRARLAAYSATVRARLEHPVAAAAHAALAEVARAPVAGSAWWQLVARWLATAEPRPAAATDAPPCVGVFVLVPPAPPE